MNATAHKEITNLRLSNDFVNVICMQITLFWVLKISQWPSFVKRIKMKPFPPLHLVLKCVSGGGEGCGHYSFSNDSKLKNCFILKYSLVYFFPQATNFLMPIEYHKENKITLYPEIIKTQRKEKHSGENYVAKI